MIDLNHFFEAGTTKLDVNKFRNEARQFKPYIIVLSICYSRVSEVKFALNESGLLSKGALSRNLCEATNGKIVELDPEQTDLINEIVNDKEGKNIKKNIVIQGPEGSGKTLLGIEIANIIVNKYIYESRMFVPPHNNSEKKIRVIFVACYDQSESKEEEVNGLINQLKSFVLSDERDKTLTSYCDVQFQRIGVEVTRNPRYYNTPEFIQALLRKSQPNANFEKTIIVIDELNPKFESDEWDKYLFLDPATKNPQVIFNLKYSFHDIKVRRAINPTDETEREHDGKQFLTFENVLVGRLYTAQRCSNQIRNFVYYLLMHIEDDESYQLKSLNHQKSSFDATFPSGRLIKPYWFKTADVRSFIKNLSSNPGLINAIENKEIVEETVAPKRIALMYDPETIQLDDPKKKIQQHCSHNRWEYISKNEIVGTEYPTVIIFAFRELHFEAFTRAVNNLIIVTTDSSK